MSQPTTCFGLFYLGHLQVGYLSQRKIYNSAIQSLKSGGDEISFTKMVRVQKHWYKYMYEISFLVPLTSMVV